MKKICKLLVLLIATVLVMTLIACSSPSGGSGSNSSTQSGSDSGSVSGTGGQQGGSGEGQQGGENQTLSFTGTVYTVLPEGTDGTAGPSWTYVHFGDWPQSEKATSVTVDETKLVMQGAFTYYLGSDNAWYAKKSTTYYKVEPIKWRVLTTNFDHDGNGETTGKKLLLAENILTNCKYYDYYSVIRNVADVTIYPNNYEHSRMRAYLNGLSYQIKSPSGVQQIDSSLLNKGFLQTAFTASGIAAIVTTKVDNAAGSTNPDSNATQFNNGENIYASSVPTYDKIFLLSKQEVTKSDYGFCDWDDQSVGNARIRGGSWSLRSPYYQLQASVYHVDNVGAARLYSGVTGDVGVVPALCLE